MPVESLKCPECGAPLDFLPPETIAGETPAVVSHCPYCGASLHLRLETETPFQKGQQYAAPLEFEGLPEEKGGIIPEAAAASMAAELVALIQTGQKIEAIKRYRMRTGVGLLEAKTAVEALEKNTETSGGSIDLQILEKLKSGSHTREQESLRGDSLAESVHALLDEGNKIAAIKLYRQVTKVGLAEAKDAVERIGAAPRPEPEYGVESSPLETSVRRLLAEGKKIEAIKLYKERTRTGLKEAKSAVDNIERGLLSGDRANFQPEESFWQRILQPPCSIIIMIIALLGILLILVTCLPG